MILNSAAGQLELDVLVDFSGSVLGINLQEAYRELVSTPADFR
jgi:hypothetical protein